MVYPPSAMLATTCLPYDKRAQVKGGLICDYFCDIPWARSIPFATATIMHCEIDNSQPAYTLWKTCLRRESPLRSTADCSAGNSVIPCTPSARTKLDLDCRGFAATTAPCPALPSLLPKCFTLPRRASGYSSLLARAEAYLPGAPPRSFGSGLCFWVNHHARRMEGETEGEGAVYPTGTPHTRLKLGPIR